MTKTARVRLAMCILMYRLACVPKTRISTERLDKINSSGKSVLTVILDYFASSFRCSIQILFAGNVPVNVFRVK